ncbi:hypothetical protein Pcinc_026212 [Petrolisthes cinctipes]|uniref:Uncharacterized protein n=1 Tax=Petrolisthes cinctipes TaxID=88211 RepID=A0AAE1F7N9_PETCI|nr:hypothetical protein Pcinc_026212 [Petrolisthes cinctipes]
MVARTRGVALLVVVACVVSQCLSYTNITTTPIPPPTTTTLPDDIVSTTTTTTTTTTIAPSTNTTTPTTTTTIVPGEDPVDQSMTELTVSRFNKYCDWTESMGPVCNYTGTDQVVVVPAGLRLPAGQLEVEVHNASILHIYPTCVSWVQVYNAGLVNTLPAKDMGGDQCRTWLRIYHSKVDSVAYGVKDLTLVHSEVSSINLVEQRDFMAINSTIMVIEALDWEGYRATVQNTVVRQISNVVARDSWYIQGAQFGSVSSRGIVFDAREMSVINTTINHIASQGLTIINGAVSFANVTLSFLELRAIQVTSPNAFLSLSNVTINSALIPCIVLLDRERISLSNVTVMGTVINQSSPFLHYIEDEGVTASEMTTQVKADHPACTDSDTTLTCDFANTSQVVELRGELVEGYQVLELYNARSLQVASTTCQVELRLHSVNATLPHVTPENSTGVVNESCSLSISAWNSSLNVIWARHVTSLNLTDSTVKRVHDGRLNALWLTGSSVEEMDKLEVAGRGAVWNNSLFLGPINVTLTAPLNSRNVQLLLGVLREGSLIIDHPGQTSKISGWRNSWMERHSLVLKRGSRLELSDVVTMRAAQEAVLLEEDATVKISNLKAVYRSYHVFSVSSRDQVEFGDSILRDAADALIHVRMPPPPVDEQSNFTLSDAHTSNFCRTIPFYLQICDFTRSPEAKVNVDLGNGRRSNRVIVKGAANVTIYPSCVDKVMLAEVKKATTVEGERDCATWLEATGVHLINVTSGVHDLTLTDCRVDLLSPDRKLRDLDLEGTTVTRVAGVAWAGYMGVVNNSHLGRVEGLRAGSRMMMSNSTIDVVLEGGLVLEAEAVIANSTIGEVKSGGIIISGSARMHNVTLRRVAAGGIQVDSGLLVMVNVQVLEAEDASITAGPLGGLCFKNVTVGGQRVSWRGYLSDSTLNHSLILRNFTAPPDPNPVSFSPSVTTSTPMTPLSPEISSQTTAAARGGAQIHPSSASPDIVAASASNNSWRWAAAGIGFFAGIVVASCIVFVVKVVKPNKGMLLMPSVLWRVREDQHELLQEDHQQQPPQQETNINSHGYRTVPEHEVL